MTAETTPTLASLAQARSRQQATLRAMRRLALVVVVLVEIAGARTHPRPALHGEGLGVLLALGGFAVGVVGVVWARRRDDEAQAPLFVLMLASAATLVWLQPAGPGWVGVFVTVGTASRLRGRLGLVIASGALAVLAVAWASSDGRSLTSIVLSEIGVFAFFVVARLSRRLGEGQEQAERLLLELQETREAQARAAVLGERQRLAREMHDVLAHSLSGLVLQLEGARLLASRDGSSPELTSTVERAHHLARAGLDEARRAIGMLRDDELPGPERLDALAREFEHDVGVPCRVEVAGEERELGSEARLTVYRVAQEALTNVRKHARPARVELHLAYEEGGARLTVEDFGRTGVPAVNGDGGGYGLTGMRERADLLGATLTAGETDSGFRVELWVPV